MIDKKLIKNQSLIQIQPKYSSREEYLMLAEKEGLVFEVLELSTPPALNESGLFDSAIDWYRESGRVSSVHGNFMDINPASSDLLISTLSKDRCFDSCRLAFALGADNVVFHCSCAPFLRGEYLKQWADKSAGFYKELLDEFDLNIFIENAFDVDADPIKVLMEKVDSDRFGVCLDVGHANYSNISLEKWFEELGPYIKYLHLSNNNGEFDDHNSVFDGSIDWENANKLWKSLNKQMPITLEFSSVDHIKETIEFFKDKHYFGF